MSKMLMAIILCITITSSPSLISASPSCSECQSTYQSCMAQCHGTFLCMRKCNDQANICYQNCTGNNVEQSSDDESSSSESSSSSSILLTQPQTSCSECQVTYRSCMSECHGTFLCMRKCNDQANICYATCTNNIHDIKSTSPLTLTPQTTTCQQCQDTFSSCIGECHGTFSCMGKCYKQADLCYETCTESSSSSSSSSSESSPSESSDESSTSSIPLTSQPSSCSECQQTYRSCIGECHGTFLCMRKCNDQADLCYQTCTSSVQTNGTQEIPEIQ